jgi:restriction system protein
MTDYYSLIKDAVKYIDRPTAEARVALHDQARSILKDQLKALGVSSQIIHQELEHLEAAIKKVSEEIPPPPNDGRVRIRAHWNSEGKERFERLAAQAMLTPLKLLGQFAVQEKLPALTVPFMIDVRDHTREGDLVSAIGISWLPVLEIVRQNPLAIYEIDPRKLEELIAGAYKEAGFDQVELTPRSADKGRDVVATKFGLGSIRIFDQVKAYRPGTLVTAEDVRSLVGVITMAGNVSKGVITTTSKFAPRILEDEYIAGYVPYRVELRDRDALLPWLVDLASKTR